MSDFIDLGEFEGGSSSSEMEEEEIVLEEDVSEALSASLVSNLLAMVQDHSASKTGNGHDLASLLDKDLQKLPSGTRKRVSALDAMVAKSDATQKQSQNSHIKKKNQSQVKQAGAGWFNMKSSELTEETLHDLKLLKMRSVLDTKRFYKRETKELPKVFQIGTVVAGAQEFYSSRLTKKERSKTFVDELLRDQEKKQSLKLKASSIRMRSQGKMNKHRPSKKRKPSSFKRKTKSIMAFPSV